MNTWEDDCYLPVMPMLLELLYSKIGCETSLNCLLLMPFYVKHVPNNSFNRSRKDINLPPIDTLILQNT